MWRGHQNFFDVLCTKFYKTISPPANHFRCRPSSPTRWDMTLIPHPSFGLPPPKPENQGKVHWVLYPFMGKRELLLGRKGGGGTFKSTYSWHEPHQGTYFPWIAIWSQLPMNTPTVPSTWHPTITVCTLAAVTWSGPSQIRSHNTTFVSLSMAYKCWWLMITNNSLGNLSSFVIQTVASPSDPGRKARCNCNCGWSWACSTGNEV